MIRYLLRRVRNMIRPKCMPIEGVVRELKQHSVEQRSIDWLLSKMVEHDLLIDDVVDPKQCHALVVACWHNGNLLSMIDFSLCSAAVGDHGIPPKRVKNGDGITALVVNNHGAILYCLDECFSPTVAEA